ncbi:MAG TPA: glycosyltransferase [Polyangiaceae bacterium]|nr:glycosyltransferase [Polyangiaceae bacterium]
MVDVSVVIPTFRRPQLLPEAIASALNQVGPSVEVIVVDDCPDGSARELIERQDDSRISYFRKDPPSRGRPALVRNSGWPKTQGRYVHFLDDDDRVAAGFYGAACAAFAAQPQAGVVFGRIEPFADGAPSADASSEMAHEREFFAKAGRRARIASNLRSRRWMVSNLLFNETMLVNSACMIRRDCIEALGGYDADLGLNEDVDFYCRAIRAYGFRFIDQVVLHYRIVPTSLMHGRENDDKLIDSYRKMYDRYQTNHGRAELFALKVLARTVMRIL